VRITMTKRKEPTPEQRERARARARERTAERAAQRAAERAAEQAAAAARNELYKQWADAARKAREADPEGYRKKWEAGQSAMWERRRAHAAEREAQRQLDRDLIHAGFRAMAKQCHPDKGGSSEAMIRLEDSRKRLLDMVGPVKTKGAR
jgi:hypothetical protein